MHSVKEDEYISWKIKRSLTHKEIGLLAVHYLYTMTYKSHRFLKRQNQMSICYKHLETKCSNLQRTENQV